MRECCFCETKDEPLRVYCFNDYVGVPNDLICEECFTPQDDGPCFDDLPWEKQP